LLSTLDWSDTLNVAADRFNELLRSTLFEVTALSSVEGVEGRAVRNVLFSANVGPFSATANALVDSGVVACARQGRLAIRSTIAAIGRFDNVWFFFMTLSP
jgi:hypothetical protein